MLDKPKNNSVIITGIFNFPSGEAASSRIRNLSLGFNELKYATYIVSLFGNDVTNKISVNGMSFNVSKDNFSFKPISKPFKNESSFSTKIISFLHYPIGIFSLCTNTIKAAKKTESKLILIYGRSYFMISLLFIMRNLLLKNTKLVADVVEPPYDYHKNKYIDPFVFKNILQASLRIKLLDSLMFFRGLKKMDYIVFITHALKNKFSPENMPTIIIPAVIFNDSYRDNKPFLINQDKPVFLYIGGFYPKDAPEKMFAFFKAIRQIFNDCEIFIAGRFKNAESQFWVNRYKEVFIKNIFFYENLSDNKLLDLIEKANFLVCFREETILQEYTFPTRIVEFLYARKPIISNAYGDIPYYFTSEKNAILVDINSTEEGMIQECLKVKKYLDEKNAYQLVFESKKLLKNHFSATMQVNKLINFVNQNQ